jgi:hypothetical protein
MGCSSTNTGFLRTTAAATTTSCMVYVERTATAVDRWKHSTDWCVQWSATTAAADSSQQSKLRTTVGDTIAGDAHTVHVGIAGW